MDNYQFQPLRNLEDNVSWSEFEQWIRDAIGSDFRWCVRPRDTLDNREMITDLIRNDMERNNGIFPQKNTFIERT